jgi:hypothetical protein
MDNQRFDHLARLLARGASRRTAIKGIAGAAVGGALVTLGLARGGEASAQSCGGEGIYCTADADCCSGVCSNYYCTAPEAPAAPACMNDGDACAADSDCCSGSCDPSSGACFTPAAVDTSTDAPADTTTDTTADPAAVTLPVTGAGPTAESENNWIIPVAGAGVAAAILGARRLRHTDEPES